MKPRVIHRLTVHFHNVEILKTGDAQIVAAYPAPHPTGKTAEAIEAYLQEEGFLPQTGKTQKTLPQSSKPGLRIRFADGAVEFYQDGSADLLNYDEADGTATILINGKVIELTEVASVECQPEKEEAE
jgi:hypothetical protein